MKSVSPWPCQKCTTKPVDGVWYCKKMAIERGWSRFDEWRCAQGRGSTSIVGESFCQLRRGIFSGRFWESSWEEGIESLHWLILCRSLQLMSAFHDGMLLKVPLFDKIDSLRRDDLLLELWGNESLCPRFPLRVSVMWWIWLIDSLLTGSDMIKRTFQKN